MASNYNILWEAQLGTPFTDIPSAIGIDGNDNSYVVGNTNGIFGSTNVGGGNDTFLTKYDTNGNQQWVRQFGDSGDVYGSSVAVDSSGNSYIVGYTNAKLGGTAFGGNDAYIAKYDTNGNQVWVQQFGTTASDSANAVAVDLHGNTFVAGATAGIFPGQSGYSNDSLFLFVAEYNPSGTQVWLKEFGSTVNSNSESPTAIAVDSNSDSYVLDNTSHITKFDKFGNQLWQIGTTGGADGIAVGASGNVYVTGSSNGGLPGNNSNGRGGTDAWIDKYDTNGTGIWGTNFGTSSNDYSTGITVDSQDNAYVTGYTYGSLSGTNAGGTDAFVAEYDLNGNQVSLQQFGTSLDDKGQAIVYSNTTGSLYLTGSTTGSLGGTNAGGIDTFVAKEGAALTNDPVYRFYDSYTQEHFYTASAAERDSLINNPSAGYSYEGVSFNASINTGTGLIPIYRFYNATSADHFFTSSAAEEQSLVNNANSGYNYEGIAFYAYGATSSADSPIYRYYNASIGQHLFTGYTSEITGLSKAWVSEGVAFKATV